MSIKMTEEEIDEFLLGRHTMNVATIGPRRPPSTWWPCGTGSSKAASPFETYDEVAEDPQPASRPADHVPGRGRRPLRGAPRRRAGRHRRRSSRSRSASWDDRASTCSSATRAPTPRRCVPVVEAMLHKRVVVKLHVEPGRVVGPPQARRQLTSCAAWATWWSSRATATTRAATWPRRPRARRPGSSSSRSGGA